MLQCCKQGLHGCSRNLQVRITCAPCLSENSSRSKMHCTCLQGSRPAQAPCYGHTSVAVLPCNIMHPALQGLATGQLPMHWLYSYCHAKIACHARCANLQCRPASSPRPCGGAAAVPGPRLSPLALHLHVTRAAGLSCIRLAPACSLTRHLRSCPLQIQGRGLSDCAGPECAGFARHQPRQPCLFWLPEKQSRARHASACLQTAVLAQIGFCVTSASALLTRPVRTSKALHSLQALLPAATLLDGCQGCTCCSPTTCHGTQGACCLPVNKPVKMVAFASACTWLTC